VVNRVLLSLLIGVAPVGAVVAQSVQVQATASDVPVKKVMLFSSGVGYFEHAGAVRGNSATQLRFKTTQINDILKSLMLQDEDGGRVGVITYPSQDPIAKTLRSFQVDITKNPSLADLLNQLRGAKVTIQAQAERMTGTILGVESRNKSVDKGEPLAVGVLNLLAGASIRSIELPAINSLTLDDAQLQDELTKALSALVVARDQDKKPVTINFTGNGERRVRIGYVVETPVWKTSYRLLLDDNSTRGRLQGWAIVENQTESDWNNVSLSLVSGRPLSFTMDLYQPLYATRPNVVPELFAGLRPQVYDGGTEEARPRVAMDAVPSPAAPRRIGYGPDGKPLANQLSEVVVTSGLDQVDGAGRAGGLALRSASSVESMGTASSLGELFQYTVAGVTLPRQKSAMIPIVTDSVEIERVSIYNASVLRSNPLNGVRLTNTSGKHLLQGPITVLDHGGYGGDARIDNLPPGQERLLSYGVDLDVKVSMKNLASNDAVVTASIYKGALAVRRRLVNSVEYSADNRSTKQKTLVIEHQTLPGWKLVDTQKPFETTPLLYRFKGSAPAGKVTTLVVKQEYTQAETIQMLSADLGQLATYTRTGEVPAPVRDAIAKAIRMRQAIVDVEREIAERAQQIAGITAEQNRIRENMKTVAPSTQYYERLLAKLNDQESSIERLQKEREALDAKRNDLRRQLDEYLAALTID
jgi:hypothetical protein